MYSWRIPIQDMSPGAEPNAYLVPLEGEPDENLEAYVDSHADSNTTPNVSGGRTALEIDETVANQFAIAMLPLSNLAMDEFNIGNLAAVNWAGRIPRSIKSRYYSNFPPLSTAYVTPEGDRLPGMYNTSREAGADPMRHPIRHPGYRPENWNHTLEVDTPLAVDEKRVQALLYLELYLPPSEDPEVSDDFRLVFPAAQLSSIEVNGLAVFSTTRDVEIKLQRSLFETAGSNVVGGFADARKLLLGRRIGGMGAMPADAGYDSNVPIPTAGGLLNADLVSHFFTVSRDAPLTFSSGVIEIGVHATHDPEDTEPIQRVQFRLPASEAPTPDLITMGSYRVLWTRPDGIIYHHPAVQAPRWWGFHRDGVLGRSLGVAPSESLRGRFNRSYVSYGGRVDNETRAVNNSPGAGQDPLHPGHLRQSVPGARALIYARDEGGYIGVRHVDPAMAADRRRYGPRSGDGESSWDRPWHFGTDSLRTLANTNRLVPKSLVTVEDWITPPGYDAAEVHLAYGLGFDEPSVSQHPAPQAAVLGEEVTFTADAASSSAVTWQWRRNGDALEGATQNTLVLSSVTGFDAGDYDVLVTNAAGSVTSNPAKLTVASPILLSQPESVLAYAGLPMQLSVVAEGTGTLGYQWRRNGEVIPGATASSLAFSKVTFRDQGQYEVIVSDAVGEVTSVVALLEVVSPAPRVTVAPAGRLEAVLAGEVTLTAEVAGPGTPDNCTWQWRRNGVNLAKANAPSLTLGNLQPGQAGVYDLLVKNSHGSALSNPVELGFPEIGRPVGPQDVQIAPGGDATLTVAVEAAVAFQWLREGKHLKGATGSSLVIPDAGFEAAGVYSVVVTTAQGKFTTPGAQLRVIDPGLLIYKLAGTGIAQEGAASRRSAFGGWLVLDRVGQRGGFLFTGANGKQKIHWTEIRDSLMTRSTGPVPGSLTVVSELVEGEVALWLSGTDRLQALSKTTRTMAPKTLSGIAHRWFDDTASRVEMTSLKLAIDTAQTDAARRHDETVEQALARLSLEMQAIGSAVVGED